MTNTQRTNEKFHLWHKRWRKSKKSKSAPFYTFFLFFFKSLSFWRIFVVSLCVRRHSYSAIIFVFSVIYVVARSEYKWASSFSFLASFVLYLLFLCWQSSLFAVHRFDAHRFFFRLFLVRRRRFLFSFLLDFLCYQCLSFCYSPLVNTICLFDGFVSTHDTSICLGTETYDRRTNEQRKYFETHFGLQYGRLMS